MLKGKRPFDEKKNPLFRTKVQKIHKKRMSQKVNKWGSWRRILGVVVIVLSAAVLAYTVYYKRHVFYTMFQGWLEDSNKPLLIEEEGLITAPPSIDSSSKDSFSGDGTATQKTQKTPEVKTTVDADETGRPATTKRQVSRSIAIATREMKQTKPYYVKWGMTLRSISKDVYGREDYWPYLYFYNESSIYSPHRLIPVEDVIYLPPSDYTKKLSLAKLYVMLYQKYKKRLRVSII